MATNGLYKVKCKIRLYKQGFCVGIIYRNVQRQVVVQYLCKGRSGGKFYQWTTRYKGKTFLIEHSDRIKPLSPTPEHPLECNLKLDLTNLVPLTKGQQHELKMAQKAFHKTMLEPRDVKS